jgi:protein-L-isoaspartate(D-aspartate) O-methyltransferase
MRLLPQAFLLLAVLLVLVLFVLLIGCGVNSRETTDVAPRADRGEHPDWAAQRARMVREQIAARGVRDRRVPEALRDRAYRDGPLPIGEGQTISQPYIVAAMSEAAGLRGDERVLEVGTGSGYQAAVLSHLAREVYTIELEPALAARAAADLARLGCTNVVTRAGDGYAGWPEAAPFDAILVTAAPDHVPDALVEQLAVGGRMVIPVGPRGGVQNLLLLEKTAEGVTRESLMPVAFVPLRRDPDE